MLIPEGKCIQVWLSHSKNTALLIHPQNQVQLDAFLASKKERQSLEQDVAGKIEEALEVPSRVARGMASASQATTREEIRRWLQNGQLPCSFSQTSVWAPVLEKLDRFECKQTQKKSAVREEQRKKLEAIQSAEDARKQIQTLQKQVTTFQKAEKLHKDRERELQIELTRWEGVDATLLRAFAESAAQIEKELVLELETQLQRDRHALSALRGGKGAKLSLLLNCFGADMETIQALGKFTSLDLAMLHVEDVKSLVVKLPKDQQIAALYTQERLIHGILPFGDHDCSLCDCESAEEITAFLKEHGLETVTLELIRQTGASGRGSLLFLSAQDLQLDPRGAFQAALNRARAEHRKH